MIVPLRVSLIAALGSDYTLADQGKIPWSLPRDTRHFRAFTQHKFMLIGRVTFHQMQGWFTTQTPIVLTRSAPASFAVPTLTASSLSEAVSLALHHQANELVISGGAQVYQAALPYVSDLILTHVHNAPGGDTRFPAFDLRRFQVHHFQFFPADAENVHPMTFLYAKRFSPEKKLPGLDLFLPPSPKPAHQKSTSPARRPCAS